MRKHVVRLCRKLRSNISGMLLSELPGAIPGRLMIPDAWNKCEIQDVSQGVGSAPAKYVNGCAVLLAQSRCKVAGSGKVREWEAGDRDVGVGGWGDSGV